MLDDTKFWELVKQNPSVALHLLGGLLLLIAFIYVMLFVADTKVGPWRD